MGPYGEGAIDAEGRRDPCAGAGGRSASRRERTPAHEDLDLLVHMESLAADAAREVGRLLMSRFGSHLQVEYKDQARRDPVTEVDRQAQELIFRTIREHYPDHGVMGEEGPEEDGPLPEYLWVVDPLDGTRNYLGGLPLFACSIGALRCGQPVVGALYVPWPGGEGLVLHARLGGGAFHDGRRLSLEGQDGPRGEALTGLPGYFPAAFRVRRRLRRHLGEPRTTGSVGFEMAMVACGVLQYTLTPAPRVWDVAGGAVVVVEAGGAAMAGEWRRSAHLVRRWRLLPLGEALVSAADGLAALRRWRAPVLAGPRGTVAEVSAGLRGPRGRRFPWRRHTAG